jgi:hypothetical protein
MPSTTGAKRQVLIGFSNTMGVKCFKLTLFLLQKTLDSDWSVELQIYYINVDIYAELIEQRTCPSTLKIDCYSPAIILLDSRTHKSPGINQVCLRLRRLFVMPDSATSSKAANIPYLVSTEGWIFC